MIPRKDNEFRVWADSFIAQCDANKAAWDVPADAVTALRALYDTYTAALTIAQIPNVYNKGATSAKKEAKKALRQALLMFIAKYIDYNPAITVPIRNNLGLIIRSTTYTPVPVPTTYPEFVIKVKAIRALEVHFRDMGSARKGVPYGYNGAVIYYDVRDTPPTDPKELGHSQLATRTPYTLTFTEADRGKRVYIVFAWQNQKGQMGPFSQIEEAFIP
jgi:hypothetical protein